MQPEIKYSTYDSNNLSHPIIEEMADLYDADFVPADIKAANPEFYDREKFFVRLNEWYFPRPKFQCVIARDNERIVGFSTASNLRVDDTWWSRAAPPLSEKFKLEDGQRTLAIFDFMVMSKMRGQKIASGLHECLLNNSNASRVTLLSSDQLQPAHSMWLIWDYAIISKRVKEDDPILDLFVLDRTRPMKVHA